MRGILRKLSTYRVFAYPFPFIVMAITPYKETGYQFIMWPSGVALILFGVCIRIWATKNIGKRIPWMKKKGKELVKTGPYAIVRNPLYSGNILITTGLSFISELVWIIPFIFFYFFTLYHLIAIYEEKKLLERWGDNYRDYLNDVPRWIPRLKNLHIIKGDGFGWKQALRYEIPSFIFIFFGIFIFILKDYGLLYRVYRLCIF